MCYHAGSTQPEGEPLVMPLDNATEAITAATASVSEPVRAAILATALAAALALKSNERTIYQRVAEVIAVGATGLVAGYAMQAANLDFWAICSGNAIIAYLGVDKVRSIIGRVVDGFLSKKGV